MMWRSVLGWTLLICMFMYRHAKGALPPDLLFKPFQETMIDIKADFQKPHILFAKYGRAFPVARLVCRSGRRNVDDFCNFQHLVMQLDALRTNLKSIELHQDRRLTGAHADVTLDKYLAVLEDSARITGHVFELQLGIDMVLNTTVGVARALGTHFQNVARFEIEIANADVGYVNTVLDRLFMDGDRYFGTSDDSIGHKMAVILGCAIAGLTLEVIDDTVELGFAVVKSLNPLELGDPSTIFDKMEQLFLTIADLGRASAFQARLGGLINDIQDINSKFQTNSVYLKTVLALHKNNANGVDFDAIAADSDDFIAMYNDYSPTVTKQDMVKLMTTIDYLMSETCDMVEEMAASTNDHIIAAIAAVKGVAQHNCDSIITEIAVLESYYENIYEMQFTLMDALTAAMKGQVALSSAQTFVSGFDKPYLDMTKTVVGLAMDEVGVQAVAHSYCNVIEYQRAGVRPEVCKKMTFTTSERTAIRALPVPDCYGNQANDADCDTANYAYIPTRFQDEGKTYIDIKTLLEGKPQKVTIPNDAVWLKKYGWMARYEEVDYKKTFYVERLELFVPGLQCTNSSNRLGARLEVESGEAMEIHISDGSIDTGVPGYIIKKLRYDFLWDNDTADCQLVQAFKQRKADGTLMPSQDVCIRSQGIPQTLDNSMYPSLFTTWTVTLKNSDCHLTIPDVDNYDYDVTAYYEMIKWIPEGDSEECWPSLCKWGGNCIEELNDYSCNCPSSTSGKSCQYGIYVPTTCDKTYNVAANRPTGMYLKPQRERKFSRFAVDRDVNTCAESKYTYTPWFYVDLPWHAVLCEVTIKGGLPMDANNQVKVALSKNKPMGNIATELSNALEGEVEQNGADYTVKFPSYEMVDLYRYLVVYEPDIQRKSQLKICDIQAYSNNGEYNKFATSSFNTRECDWSTNIMTTSSGTASQISDRFSMFTADKAVDSSSTSCSRTNKYTNQIKPWWMFTFNSETEICGVRITAPDYTPANGAAKLWAGFTYDDTVPTPGLAIDDEYFRPCGDQMTKNPTMTDELTASCEVTPMKGTRLLLYSDDVNVMLSLCNVQVFGMKDVVMIN